MYHTYTMYKHNISNKNLKTKPLCGGLNENDPVSSKGVALLGIVALLE